MPVIGNWQVRLSNAEQINERLKAFSFGETHYKLLENLAPPSALVNRDFDIVYMSESIGRFLHFTGGEPTSNIVKLVNPDLQPEVRAALLTAQRDGQSSEFHRPRQQRGQSESKFLSRDFRRTERNQICR